MEENISGGLTQEGRNLEEYDTILPETALSEIARVGIEKLGAIESFLWEFLDKRLKTIKSLNKCIHEIDLLAENPKRVQIGGSSASVAGGLITVGSLALSIFTGGASLACLIKGRVVGTGGALTNIIDNDILSEKINFIVKPIEKMLKKDTIIKDKLIHAIEDLGNWLESLKYRSEFENFTDEKKSEIAFIILNSLAVGFKITGKLFNFQRFAQNLLLKINTIGKNTTKGILISKNFGKGFGKFLNITSKGLNILAVIGLGYSIFELTTNILTLVNNDKNEASKQLQEGIYVLHTEFQMICEKVDEITNGAVFARTIKIIDQGSDYCLDVDGNLPVLRKDCGTYTQLWVATSYGYLINYKSQKALTLASNGKIILKDKSVNDHQKWRIQDFNILNVDKNMYLFTIGRENPKVSEKVSKWIIDEIYDYTFRSEINFFCLDVRYGNKNPGAEVQTFPANGCRAQKWVMKNGYIKSKLKNVIDIRDCNSSQGASVIMWPRNRGKNQMWRYNEESKYIESELNHMVLDVKWGNKNSSTPCHMWSKNDTPAQKWIYTLPREKSWDIKNMN